MITFIFATTSELDIIILFAQMGNLRPREFPGDGESEAQNNSRKTEIQSQIILIPKNFHNTTLNLTAFCNKNNPQFIKPECACSLEDTAFTGFGARKVKILSTSNRT